MQTYLPSILIGMKPSLDGAHPEDSAYISWTTPRPAPTRPRRHTGGPAPPDPRLPVWPRSRGAGVAHRLEVPTVLLPSYLMPPRAKAGMVSLIFEPDPLQTYILRGSTNQSYMYCHSTNAERASEAKAASPPVCFRQEAALTFGTQLGQRTHDTELLNE